MSRVTKAEINYFNQNYSLTRKLTNLVQYEDHYPDSNGNLTPSYAPSVSYDESVESYLITKEEMLITEVMLFDDIPGAIKRIVEEDREEGIYV